MRSALAGIALGLVVGGCATGAPPRQAATPPQAAPRSPPTRPAVPSDVKVVALEARGAMPAMWAFVSEGLAALGQPELVLMLKREQGEANAPADGVDIVSTMAKAVRAGHALRSWEVAELPDGAFGRPDLTGLLILPEPPDGRLGLTRPSLALIVVAQEELDVARHFGAPRVANLLGMQARFFPFPPWSDRRHANICPSAEMDASLVGRVRRRITVRGAASWRELRGDDGPVVLRLTPAVGRKMAGILREAGAGEPVLPLLTPPEDIEGRLVYTKFGTPPAVIMAGDKPPARVAAGFVVFVADNRSGAVPIEDGFSVFVPKARWLETLAALEGGKPLSVPVKGGDGFPFLLRWSADDAAHAASPDAISDELVDLPPGIRYRSTTAAINEAARGKLLAAFGHPDAATLQAIVGTVVVAGPGVWRWLKDAPQAKTLGTVSPFLIPFGPDVKNAQTLEGRTYLDAASTAGFTRLLASALPSGAKPKVRRPTRAELSALWSLVPFDLEEPIFVVELGPRHLLTILDKDMRLTWIDDFAGATMRPGKGLVWE